jgi:hypothetical protein
MPESVLTVLISLWRDQLLDSDSLPDVATELLVEGIDSPALRDLAGLDLSPHDPRDARECLMRLFDELDVSEPDLSTRIQVASSLIGSEYAAGRLTARQVTRYFYLLSGKWEYPHDPPEIMSLADLHSAWDERWKEPELVTGWVTDEIDSLLQRPDVRKWLAPAYIARALVRGSR